MIDVTVAEFEELVAEALDTIPAELSPFWSMTCRLGLEHSL